MTELSAGTFKKLVLNEKVSLLEVGHIITKGEKGNGYRQEADARKPVSGESQAANLDSSKVYAWLGSVLGASLLTMPRVCFG